MRVEIGLVAQVSDLRAGPLWTRLWRSRSIRRGEPT